MVEQVHTIDLHPSSTSTSDLASLSKVAGTTLAIQDVASSTRNEKASVELEVTVNKVNGSAADIMTARSTLPCLPSSSIGLMNDHDGLDFSLPVRRAAISSLWTLQ